MLLGCRSLIGYDENRFSNAEQDAAKDVLLDASFGADSSLQDGRARRPASGAEADAWTPADGASSRCPDGHQWCENSCVAIGACELSESYEVKANDGVSGDSFGKAVALSAIPGILVGAPYKAIAALEHPGVAYEFVQSESAWLQNSLVAPEAGAYDQVGSCVALSADGKTAIVGAPHAAINGNNGQGAAYVFMRDGTTWLGLRLTDKEGVANGAFGSSIALSGDGQTALIGSYRNSPSAMPGAVHGYARSGNEWNQLPTIYGLKGRAVALSADGQTALIGSGDKDIGSTEARGEAQLWGRNPEYFISPQSLAVDDSGADHYGACVALAGNGETALVAATHATVDGKQEQGVVYVFQLHKGTWIRQAMLKAADGESQSNFGYACALSSDGNLALIGTGKGGASLQGGSYLFARTGKLWAQRVKLGLRGSSGDSFGQAVALDPLGKTALVGAPLRSVGSTSSQGAAYLFDLSRVEP